MSDVSALATRYGAALEAYLTDAGEPALLEAYEVGREALEAGLGPLVLFSAAAPHQGGAHHVNEQWPAYWAGLTSPAS